MTRKYIALVLLASALLLAFYPAPTLGEEGLVPGDDTEAFAAEAIMQRKTRGGENVSWPKDPKFKKTIDQSSNVEAYNKAFQGKDSLTSIKARVFETIPATRNVVYLTYDDGPYTDEAPQAVAPTSALIDIMVKKKVTGTFFFQGIWSWKNPAVLRMVIASGSNIGNHTFHHPPDGSFLQPNPAPKSKLHVLPANWQMQEVVWARAAQVYALGGNPRGLTHYFRSPHGSGVVAFARQPASQATINQIGASGYVVINGNLRLSDARADLSKTALVRTYQAHFADGKPGQFKGEILWLHTGLKATVAALPDIIDIVRNAGYSIEALPAGLDRVAGIPEAPTASNPILEALGIPQI